MLERVSVFQTKQDFLNFFFICFFVSSYALLLEYQNYKKLTRFDSSIVQATVLSQYTKTKNQKTYQILKLRSKDGYTFYTSAKKSLQNLKEKTLTLEIFSSEKSFYEYLTSFYTYSHILQVHPTNSAKEKLNQHISSIHQDKNIASIYKALYCATPLEKELYPIFSTLGVSHLLAISGFHLGVLSAVLFFLLKFPYSFFHNKYFPYRSAHRDLFILVGTILLVYLLFLEAPPSLVRAFGMLVIGFFLYERGYKVVSMQTLTLTVIALLALFPRLLFSLGFWLSVSGVFYIFLFLLHFKDTKKLWQFFMLPLWLYLTMLPYSLAIFGSFGIYHPLSIVWTSLFSIFYPLSIFLHLTGFANLFDTLLEKLIILGGSKAFVPLSYSYLVFHIMLSLVSIYKKKALWLLLFCSSSVLIYAIYNVA